jgi:non-specific serine/threonine protein kinase
VVRHTAGLAYIALLLAQPDRELFSLAMVRAAQYSGRSQPPDTRLALDAAVSDGALRADAGSGVGPLLSEETKQEYRAEIKALSEDYDDAVNAGDDNQAAALDAFREKLVKELANATGFGGRDRDPKSPGERSRINVRKAITTAIRNIDEAHPSLARHLEASIHTGTRCSYRPATSLRWKVSP